MAIACALGRYSVGMNWAFKYFRMIVLAACFAYCGGVGASDMAPTLSPIISTISIPKDIRKTLKSGERGVVARVIDGDSLVLESGLKVSLANIQTPKMAWPDRGLDAWPLADAARDYVQSLCLDQTVQLYYSGDQRDRYGRAIAQVELVSDDADEDSIWLQHAVVAQGLARVYPWRSHAVDMKAMFEGQLMAQTQKKGIWNEVKTNGFYKIRDANPSRLMADVESVQIVSGKIVKTAIVRGTAYLNFGDDYKTDFTIAIAKPQVKKLKKYLLAYDLEFEELAGKTVQIMGWIEDQNGPIIWLSDPRRLQIIQGDLPE